MSRAAIFTQIDESLRRLGTDYIDLYQVHRYDPATPIEETLAALHDLVRAGKVRYLGASSMSTWQFAQAQYLADLHGWTRFVSMQDQYNLLMREEEREMLPFCADQGVGVLPWSPLARGRLTRDWTATTKRGQTDEWGAKMYRQAQDSDRKIVEAVVEVASERGVSRAQVASSSASPNTTCPTHRKGSESRADSGSAQPVPEAWRTASASAWGDCAPLTISRSAMTKVGTAWMPRSEARRSSVRTSVA